MLRIMERDQCSSRKASEVQARDVAGSCIRPGRGCRESHFGVPHPNPEVSVGESIEAHAWLRAEWVREMNAVCKRRENWGGEVWSCLYTQMRLLETGWLEIGHDQFHHLGRGGGVHKIYCGGICVGIFKALIGSLTSCVLLSLCRIPRWLLWTRK